MFLEGYCQPSADSGCLKQGFVLTLRICILNHLHFCSFCTVTDVCLRLSIFFALREVQILEYRGIRYLEYSLTQLTYPILT
jgi:hypothetical protein